MFSPSTLFAYCFPDGKKLPPRRILHGLQSLRGASMKTYTRKPSRALLTIDTQGRHGPSRRQTKGKRSRAELIQATTSTIGKRDKHLAKLFVTLWVLTQEATTTYSAAKNSTSSFVTLESDIPCGISIETTIHGQLRRILRKRRDGNGKNAITFHTFPPRRTHGI